jgi:S1-C subfamily serine protease
LSWFFIDKETIITANHGVNSINSNYKITDKFGGIYTWMLISKDEENDLATLKIEWNFEKFSKFKIATEISIDDEVYFIDLNWEKKFWKVLKIEENKVYSSLEFREWDSGSPLFNKKNEFIGINVKMKGESGVSIRII